MTKKKGLGRGLGSLIGDTSTPVSNSGSPLEIPVGSIAFNPLQPRSNINPSELKKLSVSISEKGVLEPLLVRRLGPDQYELIAGERRLRASQAAGLEKVPVIVREATQAEMLELALIENLLREDLNPIDEAEAYLRLSEDYNRTQEEISRLVGRERSTVANILRLLGLPRAIQEDVRQSRLTMGHARALLSLPDVDDVMAAREIILAKGLSVRETENLVKRMVQTCTP